MQAGTSWGSNDLESIEETAQTYTRGRGGGHWSVTVTQYVVMDSNPAVIESPPPPPRIGRTSCGQMRPKFYSLIEMPLAVFGGGRRLSVHPKNTIPSVKHAGTGRLIG